MVSIDFVRGCRTFCRRVLIGLLVTGGMAANAAIVSFSASPLGGAAWRYSYVLEGTAPSGGFDGLTVYFDAASYRQLGNAAAPPMWDLLLVQPDPAIPADGFVDLLNLGSSLMGSLVPVAFSVEFEYLGAGTPGSQRFELYRSVPFAVVETGQTRQIGQPTGLPEPASGALVMLALGGLVLSRVSSSAGRAGP